ncbi:MAG: hypothetical protein M3179_05515 [Actinomycetota bacterium]|nr:hypothetical protein [Actinomycetota bacterium]
MTPAAGGTVDVTDASVQFLLYNSANATMATADHVCPATVAASGEATCTLTLPPDTYTVVMTLPDAHNPYFRAPDSHPVVATVYQPGAGASATGGGWVTSPSSASTGPDGTGSFGFTVRARNARGVGATGQAVRPVRRPSTTGVPTAASTS